MCHKHLKDKPWSIRISNLPMWPSFLANYMLIATNQCCIYSEQTDLIESKEQLLYCFLTARLCLEWNLMWVSLTKHFLTFKLLSFIYCMFAQLLNHVWLFENPMDYSLRVPLSMGFFFRQEYWSGLPPPPPGIDRPKDRTDIFCISRQILYHWATSEVHMLNTPHYYVSSIHCMCL